MTEQANTLPIAVETPEPRGVWANIKMIVDGVAKAATSTTSAISAVAETADELSQTGLIMAQSNKRLVSYENAAQEKQKMRELEAKYGDLDLS